MANREISNLDLKIKLTNEYLINGGVKKIQSVDLLNDLLKIKNGLDGAPDTSTITPLANAFMLAILNIHTTPPFFSENEISEYSSLTQKATLFDGETIDTEEEFDQIYEEYKVKEHLLYRGQREAKWRLYSRLQREWVTNLLSQKHDSYESFITKLVDQGKKEHINQIQEILRNKNIDTENSISVLGYLQHHGCPTPLLDWTYSFQNALFFGIDGIEQSSSPIEIDHYFSIHFIDEDDFQDGNLRHQIETSVSNISGELINSFIENHVDEKKQDEAKENFKGRSIFDNKKLKGSGLVEYMLKVPHLMKQAIGYFSDRDIEEGILFSIINSKNITNQKGVFVWSSEPSKPLELFGYELFKETEEAKENSYRFCQCFNINKKLSKHISKKLEDDGITREYIYPTPDVSTWNVFEILKDNL